MTITPRIFLLISAAAVLTAGGANASCPGDLPPQLLEDCIVVEGSGSSFPNASYAYMSEYKQWQATKSAESAQDTHTAKKDDKLATSADN